MEGHVLRLIGASGGGSAKSVCRTSKFLEVSLVVRSSTIPHSLALYRVYTPEQMWDEVLESDIQDALGEVRLGSSFELGNFLGNDLMKGRYPTRCVPGSESLKVCFLHSRKRR